MTIMRRSAERLALRMLGQPDDGRHRLAVELDEALRRKAAERARTRLGLGGGYISFWHRWTWSVEDVTTNQSVATGWALTERGFRRRRYAAYLRVLDRMTADGRAES